MLWSKSSGALSSLFVYWLGGNRGLLAVCVPNCVSHAGAGHLPLSAALCCKRCSWEVQLDQVPGLALNDLGGLGVANEAGTQAPLSALKEEEEENEGVYDCSL